DLVGRRLGGSYEVADGPRRRRKHEHASDNRVEAVQPELQARHHAEVPAAAANRPEQVWVRFVVDVPDAPVSRHDLGGEHVVNGEAVLANEVPDTAAEGEPADADRSGVAEAGAEAVPCGRGGVLGGGEAGLSPRGTPLGVDLYVAEPGKV